MDDEWIVVGLANQNIHIFSTKTGKLHRSLEGHTSGVWALHLVSKGGVSPTPLTSTVPSAVSTPDLDSGRWTQYRTPNTSSNSPSSSSSVLSSYYSYSRAGSPGYESPPSGSSPPRSGSSEPGPSMIPPVFGPSLKQSDVCNSSLGWGQEGAIAVTAGCDREVRVWDVRSGYDTPLCYRS